MLSSDAVRDLLLFVPPFILSLSFHEYAHAWAANKLGDPTAKYLGRMTLDPLAHISWFGTVLFPALSILMGSHIFFGWANPVPVDARNFKKERRHMAYVAAAGPLSNIIIAFLCCLFISFVVHVPAFTDALASLGATPTGMLKAAIEMLMMTVTLNLFLAFFNLLPLPPLDGSRIIQGFVSPKVADQIDGFASMAQIILIFAIFTGVFRFLAAPVYAFQGLLFEFLRIPV